VEKYGIEVTKMGQNNPLFYYSVYMHSLSLKKNALVVVINHS